MARNRMTEEEWLAASDPAAMLGYVRRRATDRKLILFACACCRRVWDSMPDEACREAVEAAERFADGLATRADLDAAVGRVPHGHTEVVPYRAATAAWHAAADIPAGDAAYYAAYHTAEADEATTDAVGRAIGALAGDIFGNPFRPRRTRPGWKTPTVTALARSIYAARAFDRLPVLADALEEAGCDDSDILDHCRASGPHVRGCWAVDMLLGEL